MAWAVPAIAGIVVGAVVSKAATMVLNKIGVNEKWSGIIGAGLGMAAGYYAGAQVKGAMDATNAAKTAENANAVNNGLPGPDVTAANPNIGNQQLASLGNTPIEDSMIKPFTPGPGDGALQLPDQSGVVNTPKSQGMLGSSKTSPMDMSADYTAAPRALPELNAAPPGTEWEPSSIMDPAKMQTQMPLNAGNAQTGGSIGTN